MQGNGERLQNSIDALENALIDDGYTYNAAERHIREIVTHATMCRERVDLPPGAFRDFVTSASRMTRRARCLSDLWLADDALRSAACSALHDLIMEGV